MATHSNQDFCNNCTISEFNIFVVNIKMPLAATSVVHYFWSSPGQSYVWHQRRVVIKLESHTYERSAHEDPCAESRGASTRSLALSYPGDSSRVFQANFVLIWLHSSWLTTTLAKLDRDPSLICGRTSGGHQCGRNKWEYVWTSHEALTTLLVTPGTRSSGVLQVESFVINPPSSWLNTTFA